MAVVEPDGHAAGSRIGGARNQRKAVEGSPARLVGMRRPSGVDVPTPSVMEVRVTALNCGVWLWWSLTDMRLAHVLAARVTRGRHWRVLAARLVVMQRPSEVDASTSSVMEVRMMALHCGVRLWWSLMDIWHVRVLVANAAAERGGCPDAQRHGGVCGGYAAAFAMAYCLPHVRATARTSTSLQAGGSYQYHLRNPPQPRHPPLPPPLPRSRPWPCQHYALYAWCVFSCWYCLRRRCRA